MADQPGGEVRGAEIDEIIPFPVHHGEQVLHAAEVSLQEAGPPPDGDHPPGRGPHVRELLGDLQDLPVQVAGPLEDLKAKGRGYTSCVSASPV